MQANEWETRFTKMLGIQYPVLMAPMFLVSNTQMTIAALKCGITAAIPALNYRTEKDLRNAIDEIRASVNGPFGINLIVNSSNLKLKEQLKVCLEKKIDFFVTSLGSPKKVIEQSRDKGIKVFCDVVDLKYAEKVVKLGADALVAVNAEAGGHAGSIPAQSLIPLLKSNFDLPLISAGGVATRSKLKQVLNLGADAASIGTVFIASKEAKVAQAYKQALVDHGAKDVIKTSRLTGTPLTVIKTPYVEKMGKDAGVLERKLLKNKRLKKILKLWIALKGIKKIKKAAFAPTYKTVWCAGPVIEEIHSIRPVKEIVQALVGSSPE